MRELDTNQGIVKQNEFKTIYRAKHAKLAKAPPIPTFFYRNLPWRPLRSLRETQSYSVLPSFQNFKYIWLGFSDLFFVSQKFQSALARLWSATGTPVGRILERETPAAKTGDRVESRIRIVDLFQLTTNFLRLTVI